jgi:hypothetical protein
VTDWFVGALFIAAGFAALWLPRALRPPEIVGRNEAVRRMLALSEHKPESWPVTVEAKTDARPAKSRRR